MVAGDREVDLKKAAKASGNKKVEMLAMKDLLATTGYIRGGCSPLGMKRHYPTYLSAEALGFDFIYVSGGRRGLQLRLSPSDLLKAADAVSADIATDKP